MFNFNDLPFIDHHCHPYDPRKAILKPEFLAREFFHGMGDIPDMNVPKPRMWAATDALRYHFPFMGVVRTMICLIAKKDAETAANMILHDNAARLYGLIWILNSAENL